MKKVTGVMVYYYFICKRKLWFFSNNLNMESNSELVGIGKLVDETAYGRERKHILIDESINIDFLKDWKVIHEVKKSRKMDEASKWQLKYYMWVLKNKGVEIEKGILDYPLLRKREEVFLNEEDEEELKNIIEDIKRIILSKLPLDTLDKKVCKKCAYYELCYI
ncbi:CRISPR-associated protein Cas4 [Anaerosalibacter bizertensis]|uniref:CRISPR-associated exonuclease Cas4 n=1 Tax=Anaerosalibacter bizertensis TaxID=932217 RepID=A0A9Q4AE41_9FIRM|nr:CRISPR-associated protein Cas4 [Anaerosalibacter bizertensis]MBV1819790.1 CRISPR-associated protein Cas4 [Bacteroidales bacterium MSK.15.36]MCG4565820.1 CRISPR-associated protein Cas4 [Anaerosalibacter bizertensis]MCG4583101.1 CRISPR-associated protein Cas4 [Anaerosalibacter bizertensis]